MTREQGRLSYGSGFKDIRNLRLSTPETSTRLPTSSTPSAPNVCQCASGVSGVGSSTSASSVGVQADPEPIQRTGTRRHQRQLSPPQQQYTNIPRTHNKSTRPSHSVQYGDYTDVGGRKSLISKTLNVTIPPNSDAYCLENKYNKNPQTQRNNLLTGRRRCDSDSLTNHDSVDKLSLLPLSQRPKTNPKHFKTNTKPSFGLRSSVDLSNIKHSYNKNLKNVDSLHRLRSNSLTPMNKPSGIKRLRSNSLTQTTISSSTKTSRRNSLTNGINVGCIKKSPSISQSSETPQKKSSPINAQNYVYKMTPKKQQRSKSLTCGSNAFKTKNFRNCSPRNAMHPTRILRSNSTLTAAISTSTKAMENTSEIELNLVNCSEDNSPIGNGDNDVVSAETKLPDVVVETGLYAVEDESRETYLTIAIQVFIPFLIAGFGMVGAGLVFDEVQHWTVFENIKELVILVPALLGLKGNLEMTLASRLSTQANLGHMDTAKQQWSMIVGNLTLIQCQAIVVGFLASVVAVVMGAITNNKVELDHAYLLCASSLVTASLASFVLGLITAAVIVLSRHCKINPDNVATPIAASLGDITSLGLLAWVSTILYNSIGKQDWLAPLIIAGYVLVTPFWVWIAKKNQHTHDVLYHGWTPILVSMLISSLGGLILDFMVSRFKGIAVFQPVINGVGGNLVAVQASRISTALHKQAELGTLGSDMETDTDTVIFITPVAGFCGKGAHARTTRVLMAMVVPGHLIFIYTINYIKAGHISLSTLFVIVYLCAAVLQVAALLYIAYIMIHWMWKEQIDPDNSAIPYLTSMGDLLGISLLAVAFQFLYLVGDHDMSANLGE